MRKFVLTIVIMLMTVLSVNAQVAIENPKFFDNWYVGVGAQTSTPLSFNKVFPLNGGAAVVLGKDFTPVFGVSFEDNVWFSSHGNKRYPLSRFDFAPTNFNPQTGDLSHNLVRGNYLGLNGTVNFSNLFCGYRGAPRVFEVQGIAGLGWWHVFTPNNSDRSNDDLAAKTGVNFNFNLGAKKAHSLYIQPAVLWNLTNPGSTHNHVAFNKQGAQLALQVGYVYHFKTSNGTHYFKTWDVGAMQDEIARLNEALAKKPKVVEKRVEVEKIVEKQVTTTPDTYVFFAYDSDVLSDDAKSVLDKVTGTVEITATASPEGTAEYNKALSQRRADAVKAYLEGRGVTVNKAEGLGVQGDASGRVSIVKVQ